MVSDTFATILSNLLKKLSIVILVLYMCVVSHARVELGLFRRLDIGHFVFVELFCLQGGSYKYLFLLHENNQRWESGKQPPIQQHGPALFGVQFIPYILSKTCENKSSSPAGWHLFKMGLSSTPLTFSFSSHFPLFLLLRRCFSFMFSVTVKG